MRIAFARLVAYSSLQLPLAMAALPVVLNVAHYYGEVLKLSLALIGPILIVSRVIDAIQDPVLGYWSDRLTRVRNGRLKLVAAMLPLLIGGFFMLFDPPSMFQPGPDGVNPNPTLLSVWLFVALVLVHPATPGCRSVITPWVPSSAMTTTSAPGSRWDARCSG